MYQTTITSRLEEVAKLRHEPAAEVIAEALEIGVSKLYLDSVLKQYLQKRISRAKAIRSVGLEAVKLAEQQNSAVQKDIGWGLGSR